MEKEKSLLEQYKYNLKLKPRIDPRIRLPKGFPDISKYVKSLGGEPMAINFEDLDDTVLHILFPGGTVDYIFSKQLKTFIPELLISFAVTTEPGVRAVGTSQLDTHVVFEPVQLSKYDGEIDRNTMYILSDELALQVKVLEPERIDIRNWWQKTQ